MVGHWSMTHMDLLVEVSAVAPRYPVTHHYRACGFYMQFIRLKKPRYLYNYRENIIVT